MTRTGRPKQENTKKKVLSVRVDGLLYEKIRSYAEKNDMTVTEVVLQGLKETMQKP